MESIAYVLCAAAGAALTLLFQIRAELKTIRKLLEKPPGGSTP